MKFVKFHICCHRYCGYFEIQFNIMGKISKRSKPNKTTPKCYLACALNFKMLALFYHGKRVISTLMFFSYSLMLKISLVSMIIIMLQTFSKSFKTCIKWTPTLY